MRTYLHTKFACLSKGDRSQIHNTTRQVPACFSLGSVFFETETAAGSRFLIYCRAPKAREGGLAAACQPALAGTHFQYHLVEREKKV